MRVAPEVSAEVGAVFEIVGAELSAPSFSSATKRNLQRIIPGQSPPTRRTASAVAARVTLRRVLAVNARTNVNLTSSFTTAANSCWSSA